MLMGRVHAEGAGTMGKVPHTSSYILALGLRA